MSIEVIVCMIIGLAQNDVNLVLFYYCMLEGCFLELCGILDEYFNYIFVISGVISGVVTTYRRLCFLSGFLSGLLTVLRKHLISSVVLFPIAVTFFVTWWFIQFVDGFFSPLYAQLGIDIFGLGFVTSLAFVFMAGVFVSSWLGASVFCIGECLIKKMSFVDVESPKTVANLHLIHCTRQRKVDVEFDLTTVPVFVILIIFLWAALRPGKPKPKIN